MTRRQKSNTMTAVVTAIGVAAALILLSVLLFLRKRGVILTSNYEVIMIFSAVTTAITNIVHLFTKPLE